MRKTSLVPVSFYPPQAWQRTRRVVGVLIALAVLVPMGVLSHIQTIPEHAAKLHGMPVLFMLLFTSILLPLLSLWLLALCFRGAERLYFEIADGALIIHTLLRTYKMPLLGTTVRRTPAKLSLRLAGTGLPGLYTGLYLLGDQRARVWATVREGGVVVEGDKRWFVTPDDVEGFITAAAAAGALVQ